ncbi:CDP-glycerol glycerophosphotransferase family protein [Adlercreutzia sp. ZJ304]|uniref:CDP-glycerol glycerophosphotransferase family protein n=1 Tax=Adlercreutzia sp. ZJ304 TaxID=2709791 RepID=UPI0013E9D9B2|nr:CDP-glycerol glycerophosphotransferase family protein [Adlercreutzia sp. ZJ304]
MSSESKRADLISKLKSMLKSNAFIYSTVQQVKNAKRKKEQKRALKVLEAQKKTPRDPGPIRVVFIAQYIPSWNKLEPLFRNLMTDNRFEVSIVCVPLGIENNHLIDEADLSNDTYDWYISHGYDAINALTGPDEWFDLRSLRPDYVFHSRPYNSCMPQVYTSAEIAKYSCLCSILYSICFSKKILEALINDDYFNHVRYFFTGCLSEELFFNKKHKEGVELQLQTTFAVGLPSVDELRLAAPENEGVWEKIECSQRILWTPRWSTDSAIGGSHFLVLKDAFLEYAKTHDGVGLVIRPHPLMFKNFAKTGEMSLKEIDDFKNHCESLSNVYLDESKGYTDTLVAADILVSDMSGILIERFATEKPTILWSIENGDFTPEYQEMVKSFSIVSSTSEVFECIDRYLGEDYSCSHRSTCDMSLVLGPNCGNSIAVIKDCLIKGNNR